MGEVVNRYTTYLSTSGQSLGGLGALLGSRLKPRSASATVPSSGIGGVGGGSSRKLEVLYIIFSLRCSPAKIAAAVACAPPMEWKPERLCCATSIDVLATLLLLLLLPLLLAKMTPGGESSERDDLRESPPMLPAPATELGVCVPVRDVVWSGVGVGMYGCEFGV